MAKTIIKLNKEQIEFLWKLQDLNNRGELDTDYNGMIGDMLRNGSYSKLVQFTFNKYVIPRYKEYIKSKKNG